MPRLVISDLGEEALQHIESSFTEYRKTAELTPCTPGRILRTKTHLGTFDTEIARMQYCLLRLISITEYFFDLATFSALNSKLDRADPLISSLLENAALAASKTWDARVNALRDYHSISTDDLVGYTRFKALVDVRNSIAHGIGHLTKMQSTGSGAAARITAAGFAIVENRVIITDHNVAECRETCRELVKSLDLQLQN